MPPAARAAVLQGAKEDAAAVGKGADIVVHKAREAAEHLPSQLDQLHLPAGLHLPESAAALQARAGAAGAAARQRAEQGLASLGALGSKLVLGTHDLFEQIRRVPGWSAGCWGCGGVLLWLAGQLSGAAGRSSACAGGVMAGALLQAALWNAHLL